MKRIFCEYKPSLNKEFPWALKHPKVSSALAIFKTRKDALNWFLSLGYECWTQFQTSKRIWGGHILSVQNEKMVFEHEIDVEKYDGKLVYSDVAEEIFMSTKTNLVDDKASSKFVNNLRENVDFKILKDHKTYFPANDDFIPPVRKSAKDIQIEKLTQEISELDELLKDSNGKYSKEIEELKLKLQDSNADKEALLKEIESLRKKIVSESIEQSKEAEKVEVVKEVVREVPVYIEKEVIKEVIKEVYVESKDKKEVIVAKEEAVKYEFFDKLNTNTKLEALAIYAKQLELIASKYEKEVITSEKDFNEIKVELERVLKAEKDLSLELKNNDERHLLKLIAKSLSQSVNKLSKSIKGSSEVEYVPSKFVYYELNEKENLRLAQVLSFVSYENKHIGFVKENDYKYAIFASPSRNNSHFLVFEGLENKAISTTKAEVVVEKDVKASWAYTFWAIILYGLAYVILLALVIILAIAYFGGL